MSVRVSSAMLALEKVRYGFDRCGRGAEQGTPRADVCRHDCRRAGDGVRKLTAKGGGAAPKRVGVQAGGEQLVTKRDQKLELELQIQHRVQLKADARWLDPQS